MYGMKTAMLDAVAKGLEGSGTKTGSKCPLCGSAMKTMADDPREVCSNWPKCPNAFYS